MDFFTAQERSRRTTRILIVLFLLATAAVVGSVTLVTAAVIGLYGNNPYSAASIGSAADNWPVLLAVALGTLGLIVLASLYRMARLSQGGGAVARQLGATEVTPDTNDPLRRRLINVVEEMSIASGVPVPEVFVMEREPGINAFAAGFGTSDAAVAVTRGALEQLDRSELQGVVGHEFSHILNGDMRINMRLMGILYGILVLSLIGRSVLRTGRYARVGRSSRNGGGVAVAVVLGLALAIIGWLGVFFGRLIKAAVSRQREYLADASAVQLTRDPSGLAGALKKIGGYTGQLSATESEEVAHMLFAKGGKAFSGLFATHPPIEERIQALDATFKGKPRGGVSAAAEPSDGIVSNLAGAAVVDKAGTISPEELAFAKSLHENMPEELAAAAHSIEGAVLLTFALVLDPDPANRGPQNALLEGKIGPARAGRCEKLAQELASAGMACRLPLLEMAFPTLKERPNEQLQFVLELTEELVRLDGHIHVFEYVIVRLLKSYLESVGRRPVNGRERLKTPENRDALLSVLGVVAFHGHETDAETDAAVKRGTDAIGLPLEGSGEPKRDLSALDGALDRLRGMTPSDRRLALIAVHASIAHDGQVTVQEGELFRAVAAGLGYPLPPLVLDRSYVK